MSILSGKKRKDFLNEISKISFEFGFDFDGNILEIDRKLPATLTNACTILKTSCANKCKEEDKKSESTPYLRAIITACETIIKRNAVVSMIPKDTQPLITALNNAANAKFKITTMGAVLDYKPIKKQLAKLADELNKLSSKVELMVKNKKNEILMKHEEHEAVIKFKEERKKAEESLNKKIADDLKKARFSEQQIKDFYSEIYDAQGFIRKEFKSPKSTSLSLSHQRQALEFEHKKILEKLEKEIKESQMINEYIGKLKAYKNQGIFTSSEQEKIEKVLYQLGPSPRFKAFWDKQVKEAMAKRKIKSFEV